jgi:hypothetical protein
LTVRHGNRVMNRRRLRRIGFGCAAALLVGSGVAGWRLTHRRARTVPHASAGVLGALETVSTEPTGPSVVAGGGEVVGARAAAVRFVASTGELMESSPVGRAELLRRLVTPDALDAQVSALASAADRITESLGAPVTRFAWVEAPLTATVNATTSDGEVAVAVWTVSVIGERDAERVEQVWRTVHVTVVDTGDGWRVADASEQPGPTPSSNELALPSSSAEFVTVAAWAPVTAGEQL